MNKLSLKISVYIYVFISIILGLISPFTTGLIAYKVVNPHNVFTIILFIIVWFVISFIVLIIAKYLYEGIRYRFTKIDNYLYEIENYIENQKYN
jgi:membrane protein YdbS with pleckstrin-like domain